jgi:hypothetical protein
MPATYARMATRESGRSRLPKRSFPQRQAFYNSYRMARIYKLDHYAKGTGASVVSADEEQARKPEKPLNTVRLGGEQQPKKRTATTKTSTALPAGHVRKKATGEIGKVQSVDSKAGTVTVLWLRQGRSSTVPLSSVTRR